MKPVHEEQLSCFAGESKEYLIKSCKKNTNLFVTNEEWPETPEEELKYL